MRLRVACVYFTTARDLTSFAEACLRFSPEISIRPEQAVFLEIGKCRSLYSEVSFTQRMHVLLKRFGPEFARDARVAIDDDATRALVRAIYDAGSAAATTSTATPSLPLASFHEFSDPFLVAVKNRPSIDKMIASLQKLGLQEVAQFMRIPASELPARFGPVSLLIRSQIERSADVVWPRWSPREVIEETVELAHDDYCTWLEPLLFQTKRALDRAYARLQGRGLRCARLQLELTLEKYSTVRRPIRTFNFDFMMPQGTTRATMPILQERLEREFATHPLESAVLRVRVVVEETTPGYQRQQHLFHNRDEIDEAYRSIVSHLAESVGKTRVFRAVIQEERFPEKSWKKRENDQETHAPVEAVVPTRPSRLLSKPKRIDVSREKVMLKTAQKAGKGSVKSYTILSWSPVERISADWLQSPIFKAESRNYYQVAIAEGPDLWIYEDESRDFYLHGWYE